MARGNYSLGKRQRETEKARKKLEKAEKRQQRRERGPSEIQLATAEEMTGQLRSVDEVMAAMENRASAPRSAPPIPCRLFVGGLSWETTDQDLRAAFGQFGVVTDAVVVTDRDSGKSKGFGFVTLENRKDGPRAIEGLHDTELNGRMIVVNAATERSR
jgi:RNA recognition motif-containing protein